MYNKKDILKDLNEFNYFIDEATLTEFIKNWKIDAIYEDEDGIEFFDNLSIVKIKKGISLKSQGYSDSQIIYHINKILPEKVSKKEVVAPKVSSGELQNVTLDVTKQTLQMLAEAVAEKISADIQNQIKDSEFVKELIEGGTLKKDNEVLSKQVEELTEDNKKLAKRVEELEQNKNFSLINFEYFRKLFTKKQ